MNCTSCGATILDNTKFCTKCGRPVQAAPEEAAPTAPEARGAQGNTCPTCGASLLPNAKFCAKCGSSVAQARTAAEAAQPEAPPQRPPAGPPTASVPPEAPTAPMSPPPPSPAAATGTGVPQQPEPATTPPTATPVSAAPTITISLDWLNDMASRWGGVATSYLMGGAALAAVALIMALAAHINYLVAERGIEQVHADIWLTVSFVIVLAAVGSLALGRTSAEGRPASANIGDLWVGIGLSGMAGMSAFVGLILGLDERFDAMASWMSFALVWAFVALGWLLVSRPVPREWTFQRGAAIGGAFLGAAALFALIGLAVGLGDDFGDFIRGQSWLQFALTGAVLGIGWLFGLRPQEQA